MTPPPLRAGDAHPFVRLDVPTLLAWRADTRRDHPFIVWEPFEGPAQTWTFGAFHHAVGRVAGGLVQRGVRPGERVLIHLDNCPEALLAWYACAWVGAVAVTTNARAADDELSYYARWTNAMARVRASTSSPLFKASSRRRISTSGRNSARRDAAESVNSPSRQKESGGSSVSA